jgi:hypothetical protein
MREFLFYVSEFLTLAAVMLWPLFLLFWFRF